jgi:phosphatidylglycerophosphate synthase
VFLDVLDGYIARKTGQTSEFGRVFDMEVDAFFVNSMGLYFLFTTNVGYLMLLPGVLRYLYRLAVWSLPQPDYQETKKFYAAALAGINFVLIVLAVIAPNPAQIYILFLSIILVSLSFTISFYEFFRHASRH